MLKWGQQESELWVVTWKMPFPAVYVVIIKAPDWFCHIPALDVDQIPAMPVPWRSCPETKRMIK